MSEKIRMSEGHKSTHGRGAENTDAPEPFTIADSDEGTEDGANPVDYNEYPINKELNFDER